MVAQLPSKKKKEEKKVEVEFKNMVAQLPSKKKKRRKKGCTTGHHPLFSLSKKYFLRKKTL